MSRYRRVTSGGLPQRPEQGAFISGLASEWYQSLSDASGQMTPARMAAILRQAEEGDITAQAALFDRLQEDPHILAVYGKRKRASRNRPIQINAADDTPQAQVAAELCREVIAGIRNWREAVFHLLDAVGRGFSVCQIEWELSDSKFVIPRLIATDHRAFVLDREDWDKIRVLTDANMTEGEPLAPAQWLVHIYRARSGSLATSASLRALCWAWLFKHASWRDWVIFSEAYGMPKRLGTYPRGATDEERRVIWAAAKLLGRDGAAAIPEGAKLEYLKAEGGRGDLPFEALIQLADRYVSKLILGQTMTTEEGDRGARSLGEVHRAVEDDLVEDTCDALAETIRFGLCEPITRFNMGDAPTPKVSAISDEGVDLLHRAQTLNIVARWGTPLSRDQVREEFNLQEPKDEDDALVVAPAATGQQLSAARDAAELRRLIELVEEKKNLLAWAT